MKSIGNFRNIKLGTKLVGGFIVVAFITLGVGFAGWWGASKLKGDIDQVGRNNMPSIHSVLTMKESLTSIKSSSRTLLSQGLTTAEHERQYARIAKNREDYAAAMKVYEGLISNEAEKALLQPLSVASGELKKENDVVMQYSKDIDALGIMNTVALRGNLEKFTGDHYKVLNLTADLLLSDTRFEGGEDHTQCAFGKWMAGFKTSNARFNEALGSIQDHHQRFHASVKKIKELEKAGDKEGGIAIYHNEMIPSAKATLDQFGIMNDILSQAVTIYDKMERHLMGPAAEKFNTVTDILDKIAANEIRDGLDQVKGAEREARRTQLVTLSGMIGGSLLALALGIGLSFSITRPVRRVIGGLSEASDQVAAASSQVAGASQQLAEGASEQAASIEETSSSLEEMSSMTRQNADNANQAKQLMTQAQETVSRAGNSMEGLTTSMGEISRASEATSKIIKTIDEIAFQTNLLALNAAVEAARAGEVGAGFAVVADEVRNLAMRAAEAAKNTSDLIEGTVKKVKEGSELVVKTSTEFREVALIVERSSQLIGEISGASLEQAQGVEQVNKAVGEMDKVVQQNAANAEESASASEEMNAQAYQMKEYVEELRSLVDGSRGKRTDKIAESAKPKIALRNTAKIQSETPTGYEKKHNGHVHKGNGNDYKTGKATRSERMIPFDDGEISEF